MINPFKFNFKKKNEKEKTFFLLLQEPIVPNTKRQVNIQNEHMYKVLSNYYIK